MTITTARPVPTAAVRPDPTEPSITVRPLRPGEATEVRRVFRTMLPLGHRLELQHADIVDYERQCLDWHLSRARGLGRVAELDGRIVGFALPCLDRRALDRWERRRAAAWTGRAIYRFGLGRLGAQGRRFVELRLRDLLDARQRGPRKRPGCSALVQVVTPSPAATDALLAATDEIVARAGLAVWSYDVQLREPTPLEQFQRGGQSIERIALDKTLSWLAASPVLRVAITRQVGPNAR